MVPNSGSGSHACLHVSIVLFLFNSDFPFRNVIVFICFDACLCIPAVPFEALVPAYFCITLGNSHFLACVSLIYLHPFLILRSLLVSQTLDLSGFQCPDSKPCSFWLNDLILLINLYVFFKFLQNFPKLNFPLPICI